MAARDVAEQGAKRGGGRRRHPPLAFDPCSGRASCQQADGGALDVALAARDLPGEAEPRIRAKTELAVQQLRAVEEGVAVQAAEARELGALQPRNHAQDARLLAVLQLGL